MKNRLKNFSLLVLFALLLAWSFPRMSFSVLAFVAFVPLFYVIYNETPRRAFLLSWLGGFFFYLTLLYWIVFVVNRYGGLNYFLGAVTLCLLAGYQAVFFGLFGMGWTWLKRRVGSVWVAPFLFVVIEYLRSLTVLAFPWDNLGYSQIHNMLFIQIADVTGVYGLSFLIVCVNVMNFIICRDFFGKEKRRRRLWEVYAVIMLLTVYLVYGYVRVHQVESRLAEAPKFKFALIQGNIEQGVKWTRDYRFRTLKIYQRLTQDAAREKPELVVWPETAAPFNFLTDIYGRYFLFDLASQTGSDIVFGSPTARRIKGKDYYYNSAFLISPDKKVRGQYDKMHLVPFGEFVPCSRLLFFVEKLAHGVGDFTAGEEALPIEFSRGKAAILICFEGILPQLVRGMVKDGAQVLVNITNDAWFGPTSAPYQHLEMAAMRAVENRVYLLRAANTGVSAYVDPLGRIHSPTNIYTEATVIGEAALGPFGGVYSKIGDTFVLLCLLALLGFAASAGLKSFRQK